MYLLLLPSITATLVLWWFCGGVYLGPEYHLDMIRAGGLLYGTVHAEDPAIEVPVVTVSQPRLYHFHASYTRVSYRLPYLASLLRPALK